MEFKKKIYIFCGIVGVLTLILFGLKLADSSYKENYVMENPISNQSLYQVNSELGEKLIPCMDGSYDVYKPNKSIMLCGSILTVDNIEYLNGLE